MQQNRIKYNNTLANYFSSQPLFFDGDLQKKPHIRKCMEQPFQQTKAELWEEVTATLCNLDFIQAKAVAKMTYDLVSDFNEVLEVIPDNAENIRQKKVREARMEKYIRDLIDCAEEKISIEELEIPESITPWSQEKIDTEIERMKTNPTRVDKLKDFIHFLGNESGNLQSYAHEFPYFTTQQAWNWADNGSVCSMAEKTTEIIKSLMLRHKANRPYWNPLPPIIQIFNRNSHCAVASSITPNGKILVTGSYDNTCIVWNVATGKPLTVLNDHNAPVRSVSITPDGKMMISGSDDKTCILWDLVTGHSLQILSRHTNYVHAVSITSDGKKAISGSWDKTCIVWDLERGLALRTLKGHSNYVTAVSITPDGTRAISGSLDYTLIVWNLKTGKIHNMLKGHSLQIRAVSITPDGQKAISGSDDMTCILWDIESGKIINILKGHSNLVSSVSITPDGKKAISGSHDKTCIFWNLETGKICQIMKNSSSNVSSVSITPDAKRAVVSFYERNIYLWELETSKEHQTQIQHAERVEAVTISPNGEKALSCSRDKTCILWNLKTGQAHQMLKVHSASVYGVSFTPDGRKALSGSDDWTCKFWEIETGRVIRTFKHNLPVLAVALTPDGKKALSGTNSYDHKCFIWDLETGALLNTLEDNSNMVKSIIVTPDCKRVITATTNNVCIVWDINSGKKIHTIQVNSSETNKTTITSDGEMAITVSFDSCLLWNLNNRKRVACFVTESEIASCTFSPNGILLGCVSGEVIILNIDKFLLHTGIPVINIRQIWEFESHHYLSPSTDCPLCGHRFEPPHSVLATIEEITLKAGLSPDQSPCLELPDEAWEDPGLLGNCPNCGAELKFNPFIAGGAY